MSVFLTPELKPFYGGTYFPPEDRYGRAVFPRPSSISDAWQKDREGVERRPMTRSRHWETGGGPPQTAAAGRRGGA